MWLSNSENYHISSFSPKSSRNFQYRQYMTMSPLIDIKNNILIVYENLKCYAKYVYWEETSTFFYIGIFFLRFYLTCYVFSISMEKLESSFRQMGHKKIGFKIPIDCKRSRGTCIVKIIAMSMEIKHHISFHGITRRILCETFVQK